MNPDFNFKSILTGKMENDQHLLLPYYFQEMDTNDDK